MMVNKHKHAQYICLIAAVLLLSVGPALAGTYAKAPWTFTVDEAKGTLSISHARLGVVLENARLEAPQGNRLAPTTGWTVADRGAEGIAITAKSPAAVTWEIRTSENAVEVRSAAAGTRIAAVAPATAQRIPARLAEPGKMQSKMVGKEVDYTGSPMEERWYTPSENPHVMYLALGPVEGRNVEGLFDRPTDIAIHFAKGSGLVRDAADQWKMRLTTPITATTALVSLLPDYYVKVLGNPRYVPYDDTYHKTAPTGWNHWLAFFRDVNEKDIVAATDWIEGNLKAYGMIHVQLDDGADHPAHRHWDKDWDPKTFPHGPVWLASYIKSKGFIPGLWTVPYSYCVEHGKPEWFLRDGDGKVVMDYQGGGVIDPSRPETIRDYWIPMMKSLKSQGWGYHKWDMGSTVQQWEKYQQFFYNRSKSTLDVSIETMKIMREIWGPEMWHTNHPDNAGGRMGLVDVVGCGRDPGPGWTQMSNNFEVISNNTYQNHIIWYSDPDCICLRGKPTRVDLQRRRNTEFFNLEEARTAASMLSISGLQWLSGDDMPNLDADRVDLIKKSIPILPIFPVDLFGRGRDPRNFPKIYDLKVNQPSGKYDVVAAVNWSKVASEKRTINFAKELGLEPGRSYAVFDFWKERLVQPGQDSFETELPPHGTAVFQVHPLLDRPQLLATNRHLTGVFGIRKQGWTVSSRTLAGTSETVPGARYALFIRVPKGMKVAKATANAAQVEHNLQPDGLLKVSFLGQAAPVDWSVTFAR
jgi:hypothetical protein